jgi:hypothetical protein
LECADLSALWSVTTRRDHPGLNSFHGVRGVKPPGTLKVSIRGDKVKVNDADYGKLRPGDFVLIGDDGVAVNSLDYGESEKYLRSNSSGSETSALNQ